MGKFQTVLKVSRRLCEENFVRISFSCLRFASIFVFGTTYKKQKMTPQKSCESGKRFRRTVYRSLPVTSLMSLNFTKDTRE